jgi:hypothetical protein
MSIRSLFFLAVLGVGLFSAPVHAQNLGYELPEGVQVPWDSANLDLWNVHFRAAHLRENQPFPLEALLRAYLHRGEMNKRITQDQLARLVELSFKTFSQLPKMAEEQYSFSSATPAKGFELAVLFGERDEPPSWELCWRRCGPAASHNELEFTFRRIVFVTEEVRFSFLLGLCWTDKGLGWRVSCRYEFYLGEGEEIFGEVGANWIFGDGPHLEARMSMCWFPVEDVELNISYDLMHGRLWHGGSWHP